MKNFLTQAGINQTTLDLLREADRVYKTPEEHRKVADLFYGKQKAKAAVPVYADTGKPVREPGDPVVGNPEALKARKLRKKRLRKVLIRTLSRSAASAIKHGTLSKSVASAIKHVPGNIGKTFKHLDILGHHEKREDSNMKYYITQAGYEVINEGERLKKLKGFIRKHPVKTAATTALMAGIPAVAAIHHGLNVGKAGTDAPATGKPAISRTGKPAISRTAPDAGVDAEEKLRSKAMTPRASSAGTTITGRKDTTGAQPKFVSGPKRGQVVPR